MSETLVLIILAVVIILIGIGMVGYRKRQVGGAGDIASGSAAYVPSVAGKVGGYLKRVGDLRHRFPRVNPVERDEYLRREQHRYEELPSLSESTGPITDLLGVILNIVEYSAIGRYLREKREERVQETARQYEEYRAAVTGQPPPSQPPRKGRRK